ncbi:MAG: RNA-directed DNA polymerase [Acaryochloridaceae cyanobacterium RU_4_10]|nr:RNA-directed DNA polymerase [Acaryochloridaceae cyanobacterium RU_4_10]
MTIERLTKYFVLIHQHLLHFRFELADDETKEHFENYLPIWASAKRGEAISRGLPQGCLASDLFANIFLLKFDKELSMQEFHYLRYVDDIRLLSNTREAVQKGLICIDRNLKTSGLLIQTNKTLIRKISNFQDEADRLASQLSEIDQALEELDNFTEEGDVADTLAEPSLHDIAKLGYISSQEERKSQISKNEL